MKQAGIVYDSDTLRIVCLSDTHNDDPSRLTPPGDILIHAGDLTDYGTFDEFQTAFDWLCDLPHKVKVVVAGQSTLPFQSPADRLTFS